jgi:excinuclease ABC subunit B
MSRAINETNRRRVKQLDFNRLHGITPQGIVKGVQDIMEGARSNAEKERIAAAEPLLAYGDVPPEQIVKRIKKLEQEMFRLARNLEFEEAARLRDQIEHMRKAGLGLGGQRAS